jgi:DNA polymerase I-like protein with 3'-5' exonuclease and polymerase domains
MKKRLQVSDWTQELTEEQKQYAADDVRLIFFLYRAMNEDLDSFCKRYRRSRIHDNIKFACKLIIEFALMEIRGIDFDKAYHSSKVIAYLEEKFKEAQAEVGKFFFVTETFKTPLNKTDQEKLLKLGLDQSYIELLSVGGGRGVKRKFEETITRPINISSPKQLMEALRKIGLKPLNTTEDEMKRCKSLLQPGSPEFLAVSSVIKAKKAASLLSKFGQALLDQVHPDGRIHPHLHQIGSMSNGVDTLRSSSSEPNIMQMPMRDELFEEAISAGSLFRRSFIALEGDILIDLDLSQIEPRMAAQITQDPYLIEELSKEKADLHALTAMILLGLDKPPEKHTYEREYIGKTANLAMSYGIGPKKLAKFMYDETISKPTPVRWTVDEAREYLDRYYGNFSNIQKTMVGVQNRLALAVEHIDSLAAFKGRHPIHIEFNASGAHRGWYLTELQERLSNLKPEVLHRDYLITEEVPVLDEYGDIRVDEDGKPITELRKSKWNEWHKTMNRIAREAYNFANQSECALILKRAEYEAGLKLRSLANPLEYGIIAVVHDELLVRMPKHLEEQAREILTKEMIGAGEQVIKVVPVKVGVGSGASWADAK